MPILFVNYAEQNNFYEYYFGIDIVSILDLKLEFNFHIIFMHVYVLLILLLL